MFVLSVYLHVLMVLCISLGAHGELTADVVFTMLNSRLNNLEIVTFSLDAGVKRINERLDNLELASDTQLQVNDNNVADSREGNPRSDPKNMNRKMMKALASEKMLIRNALSEYEGKFAEFQKTVKDQIDVMNYTFEASSAHLKRRIEENVASVEASNVQVERAIKENEANMNSSLHQLTMDSETMLKDAMSQFEVAITNASTEHKAAVSKINENKKSIADIEEDFNGQTNRIDRVDSRVTSLHNSQSRDISSVRSRVSSVEGKLRTLDNDVFSLHSKRVGFTAWLSKNLSFYSKRKIIVFDKVITNYGGGYSGSTGKFTAPKSGLYLFQFNVQASSSQRAHAFLRVNGYIKAEAIVNKGPNFTGSNAAVAYMHKGEQACVRTGYDSSYGIYSYRTSFTGVLIN